MKCCRDRQAEFIQIQPVIYLLFPIDALLTIKPEDVLVKGDTFINCKVQAVENMGNFEIIYFEVNGLRIIATTDRATNIYSGKNLKIGFKLNNLHVFDNNSGNAAF